MGRKHTGFSVWLLGLTTAGITSLDVSVACAQTNPPQITRPASNKTALVTTGTGQYYFEFRSRQAWDYGHTFVVFGRVICGGLVWAHATETSSDVMPAVVKPSSQTEKPVCFRPIIPLPVQLRNLTPRTSAPSNHANAQLRFQLSPHQWQMFDRTLLVLRRCGFVANKIRRIIRAVSFQH